MALQIKRKFIEDSAIDGEKLKLSSGQAVKVVKADGTTEVRLIELDESTNKVKVNGEAVALESALSAEESARVAADSALDARLDALEGSGTGSVAAALVEAKSYTDQEVASEEARAVAAEQALDARLDVIEGSGNGSVAKALSDANSYTDQEVSAEETARIAADDVLSGRLDVIEGSGEGSVAKALVDAKAYTDAEVATEKSRAEGVESSLQSQIDAITGGASGSLSSVNARLDVLEGSETTAGSVAKALKDAKDYVDDVIGISSAAVAAFSALASQMSDGDTATGVISALGDVETRMDAVEAGLAQELLDRAAADTQIATAAQALVAEEADARVAADAALQGSIDAEASARISADNALDARLDIIEGDSSTFGSIQNALSQAVLHANTLNDIESSARIAADSALDTRVVELEARLHRKMKFTLTSTDIANGFVELAHEAMENSIVASVGRLMIHEGMGEDFTVSVVNGKTRMTFVGNLVSPSQEQLAEGDILFVKYMNV